MFRHSNKHLIDQACSVRIGGYLSCTFLCVVMDLAYSSVHTTQKTISTNILLSGPHARSITTIYHYLLHVLRVFHCIKQIYISVYAIYNVQSELRIAFFTHENITNQHKGSIDSTNNESRG
jgi:hypothetical protein